MKKITFKKSVWQTIISVFALALFTYLATGYITTVKTQETKLKNGDWERAQYHTDGHAIIYQGPRDKWKRYNGLCTREHQDADGNRISIEKGTWKNGRRHGVSVITFRSGDVNTRCYKNGQRVECDEKSAYDLTGQTAFEVFNWRFPWYNYSLNAFGYDDVYIKSFMDTLETIMNVYEDADKFKEDEFSDYYNDAIDDLEDTPYDSIIQKNSEHAGAYGMDLILNTEFRLATFDRYYSKDKDTYKIVKNKYPNYLRLFTESEITESDFEIFCHRYDSLLTSYGSLDENDDYFADSIDNRIYRALSFLGNEEDEEEEKSSILLKSLDLDLSDLKSLEFGSIFSIKSVLLTQFLSTPTSDVATSVFFLILFEYVQADLIMQATQESYFLKNGVVMLPALSTDFVSNNSSSSVTIGGNVINNGGGEISKRGVVWSKGYNPILTNEKVDAGTGNGEYEATINGLKEGETYYARSYATNSAGTAYGNNIEFIAARNVTVNELELEAVELKVYPNPAKENITLAFNMETTENLILKIINVNGQVVQTKRLENLPLGENKINLDIMDLENGLYNCRLTNNSTINLSRKLLIAK